MLAANCLLGRAFLETKKWRLLPPNFTGILGLRFRTPKVWNRSHLFFKNKNANLRLFGLTQNKSKRWKRERRKAQKKSCRPPAAAWQKLNTKKCFFGFPIKKQSKQDQLIPRWKKGWKGLGTNSKLTSSAAGSVMCFFGWPRNHLLRHPTFALLGQWTNACHVAAHQVPHGLHRFLLEITDLS